MRQKGFTVIETTLVLIILGIILGISMASYRNYIPRMRLNAAKDEVMATLQLAQAKAMAERKTYQVIFNKATNTYRINPGSETKELPTGTSIVDSSVFEFYSDRTAQMIPSSVTIENAKHKSVRLYVIPATGYIRAGE